MQNLLEPSVLRTSATAALITSALCLPRIAMSMDASSTVWFMTTVLFGCTTVLWGFVFAWHGEYSGRPVITLNLQRNDILFAIGAGITLSLLLMFVFDPIFFDQAPKEYPHSFQTWIAMALFGAAFQPLFFLFAPFAFFIRLFGNQRAAMGLTVIFVVILSILKTQQSHVALSLPMMIALIATRALTGFLALHFYLRGGILLVLLWGAPIELRLLTEVLRDQPF